MSAKPDGTGYRILTINPGSTSTKLALHRGEEQVASASLTHDEARLRSFRRLWDQLDFRSRLVAAFVAEAGPEAQHLDAVVGRGGLLRPLESGVYEVDDEMLADLRARASASTRATWGRRWRARLPSGRAARRISRIPWSWTSSRTWRASPAFPRSRAGASFTP